VLPTAGSTVRIVAFTSLFTGTYKGGPVDVRLDLENIGTTAATVTVRMSHEIGVGVSQLVTVPPKSVTALTSVQLRDEKGIDESCTPHQYVMTLEGTGADLRTRRASIVPTCSWSGTFEDEWATLSAADRAAAQKGKTFLSSVVVSTGAMCQTPALLRATVKNQSATAGVSLGVSAKSGTEVRGHSLPLAVPVGGTVSTSFNAGSPGGSGTPADLSVTLVDSQHSTEIVNRSLTVKLSRGCRLNGTPIWS
jgi:hypothetical protein